MRDTMGFRKLWFWPKQWPVVAKNSIDERAQGAHQKR